MKKLISLLLALVLCFGVLTGVSFAAAPDQCTPEQAAVVVTHKGDATAKYYFDTFTENHVNWACKELEGDTTMTLLKDIDIVVTTDANYIDVPTSNSGWFASKPGDKTLIIDLGGKTMSYEGKGYLFSVERYGITIKNGTIDYNGKTGVFLVGTSTGNTTTTSGSLFKPVINLEKVHIYNNATGNTSRVMINNLHGTTINVKDSLLYAASMPALCISKTDQSKVTKYKKWEGAATITVSLDNSTVISGGEFPVEVTNKIDLVNDSVSVKIKNSTLVSTVGAAYNSNVSSAFNTYGMSATEKAGWSMLLKNGQTASGTAYLFGAGSSEGKLPFTDVAESAWYYTFVRDLYNSGVINGMTETTFAPEGTLTYGQALKLITLAVGDAEQAPIDSHWASGYLNNAMGRGWLYENVNLDGKISRLQFCQLAAAAAGIVDQPASNPFSDTADTSVLALYNAGIINGMTETTFSPNSSLTRAQISKIIHGIIAK